jgi:hypothetical protein
MTIRDLFAKDPCRHINPVVRADERDSERLGRELDEYVVTSEIDRHLREFLGEFVSPTPVHLCHWVSGWFGAGKSHFLKFLGSILADLSLRLPSGAEVGARSYLFDKWSLPFAAHLESRPTRVVFMNLLEYTSRDAPGLSEIVYRGLMTAAGFADEPWIAEMENELARVDLLDAFAAEIHSRTGREWPLVRSQPIVALPSMAEALVAVAPDRWSTTEIARDALQAQRDVPINPHWLIPRLKAAAEAVDPAAGRLVLALDEVGLYLGDVEDRYTELKALAEGIAASTMDGKLWLIVTSQEAPELKIPEIVAHAQELQWLRDRFRLGYNLTPENIETVVRERLLKKSDDGSSAAAEAIRPVIGTLATGATVTGVRRLRETFTAPDVDQVVETYPLLPYQARLITELLGELRSRAAGGDGLTGRERGVLTIAQDAICNGTPSLAQQELGGLVTLDRIYEAILGYGSAIPSDVEATIRELHGEHDGVSVASVAKSVYLLQPLVAWLPVTAENIAATLYPSLGARSDQVLAGVQACLAELLEASYVGEREGTFRFLNQIERTFEEDVQAARRRLSRADRDRVTNELLHEVLDDFTSHRFRGGVRVFDVVVEADGSTISRRPGHLKLIIQSPLAREVLDVDELERVTSVQSRDTTWLVVEPTPDIKAKLERLVAIDAVLEHAKRGGPDSTDFLREQEQERERLRHVTLPNELRSLFGQATMIAAGERRDLNATTWKEDVDGALEDRAEELFFEFTPGAASVRDEDVGKILSWQGGALPACYRELQVVDDDAIRLDSPLLARVLGEVKRRADAHEPLTGEALAGYFDAPPYGWDERIVRLALASLLREAAIEIRTAEGVLRSYREPRAARAVTDRRAFRPAQFQPAEVLSSDDRKRAADLLAQWFDELRDTPEQLDQSFQEKLAEARSNAQQLTSRLDAGRLGGGPTLRQLTASIQGVLDQPTATARLRRVLDKATELEGGLRLLRKLLELDQAGGLDKAAQIATFATALSGVDNERSHKLGSLLAADDLPSVWQELLELYEATRTSFAQRYGTVHAEVRERASAVAEELRQHPRGSEIATEIGELAGLTCPEAHPSIESPSFRCPTCHRSVPELERDLLRFERERARLLEVLAAHDVDVDDDGRPVPLTISRDVEQPPELEKVLTDVRAYASAALKNGPLEVRVEAKLRDAD